MTICTLVLGIITCIIAPGTRLSPVAAAAILAPNQFVAPPEWARGPIVTVVGSSNPSLGPWDFPAARPVTRLDGTAITDPPWPGSENDPYVDRGARSYGLSSRRGDQYDARIYTDDKVMLARRALDRDVSHRSALERTPEQPSRQTDDRQIYRSESTGHAMAVGSS